MGFFDEDARLMLDVYLLETGQLMENLDKILLDSERENKLTQEDVHAVFRIMHTAKSSSAMMGLGGISELAHQLEDLFEILRERDGIDTDKIPGLFEILFETSDFIKQEMQNMEADSYQPSDTAQFKQKINEVFPKVKEESASSQEEDEPASQEAKEELPGNGIRVYFVPDCRMEHVRAYMLMRQILQCAPEAKCIPANPQSDPNAAEFIQKQGFLVQVGREHRAEVLDIIKRSVFVSRCAYTDVPEQVWPETTEKKLDLIAGKKAEEKPTAPGKTEAEFLNVRVERLDILQNLTAELLIQLAAIQNDLKRSGNTQLEEKMQHSIVQLLDELESTVMHIRMVPVAQIVPKLRRIVRDISKKQQKEIEFVVEGQEAEADKNIVDKLSEAAMHVIRNAVDHGIESPAERSASGKTKKGVIRFDVENAGGNIVVKISDDGRGMDVEKLKQTAREKKLFQKPEEEYTTDEILELSMFPGLSTSRDVNEYSGRGVGMDIVRKLAEDNGGHVKIHSEAQKGTAITISLPLTHTIVSAVVFCCGGRYFAVPSHQVVRFIEYRQDSSSVQEEMGKQVISFQDCVLPVIDVGQMYGLKKRTERGILIWVKGLKRDACLLAEQVVGEEKIVIKPLPHLFGPGYQRKTGLTGYSILGDGDICMYMYIETILDLSEKKREGEQNDR